MSTTQTIPETNEAPKVEMLEVSKTILDLDSKGEVTLVKSAAPPAPITSMEDFVSRMGNDAEQILKYAGVAYLQYFKDNLESNPEVPWQLADEDEEGNVVLVPFTGTPIADDKLKQLNATVINLAKMVFGYSKKMVAGATPEAIKANRAAKAASKAQALEMVLANPAAVEALKK